MRYHGTVSCGDARVARVFRCAGMGVVGMLLWLGGFVAVGSSLFSQCGTTWCFMFGGFWLTGCGTEEREL